MDYTQINFTLDPVSPGTEILIAQLSELGFESFEETESGVKAYIPADSFQENQIVKLQKKNAEFFRVFYTIDHIPEQNWNEVWESCYDPVTIKDLIHIRATFHPENSSAKYQILIEPRMSFGTAHHETTSLMLESMLEEDLVGKNVLDIGCGTGILAILAELLGAANTDAIDNDSIAYENAIDNVKKNNCRFVHVHQGDASKISGDYDCILANINRNILMKDLETYTHHLRPAGTILLSGFFKDDIPGIEKLAHTLNLKLDRSKTKKSWAVARFVKQS